MRIEPRSLPSTLPFLGDLPFVGALFRSESRSRRKTNLMVFLRPVVLRDARQTTSLALDRYDLMRAAQQDAQPAQSSVLQVNEDPVLPQQLPPLQPGAAVPPAAPASRPPQ